jgi:hypothetical protein
VGVHHQHIYNFRLEMDVDGIQNSFVEMDPMAVPNNNEGPRKSVMVVEEKTVKNELDAAQKFDNSTIRLLVNPNEQNSQGYSTGYQLIPNAGGTHPFAKDPLFTPDDWLIKRANFVTNHIWITNYNAEERYPEGEYPNQSQTDTGLGEWTQDNSSIENTDNVVWLTTGATHITRAEEWPIMPTEWSSMMLKPFNFFDRTPTIDQGKDYFDISHSESLSIVVEGKSLETIYKPILINNQIFVPIREYTEALGAKVGWEESTERVTITYDKTLVQIQLDNKAKGSESEAKPFEEATLHNEKTYVSLQWLEETFGLDVRYNEKYKTIYVNR